MFTASRPRRSLCSLCLFTAVLGPPHLLAAQSSLADDTSVVVTQAGLFLVPEGQPAVKVFDATPFGGGILESPSVTWLPATNLFFVTRRDTNGNGGLFRVALQPNGTGTVEDLTPALPAGIGRDFVDTDYSVGLDTLFVLERESGLLLVDAQPATSTGASFAPWSSVPADEGVALTVRGAKHPFSVLVVKATGEVLRVDKFGAQGVNVNGNPSWTQVSTNPISGTYFLCSQGQDNIVVGTEDPPSGLPTALIDLNVWQFCGPLAQEPLDIVWDARTERVVALAGDILPDCAFGPGYATGKNHVIRLPVTASGPPSAKHVLLTSPGDSGVVGSRGDLALVRYGTADITWFGPSGSGAGSSVPVFGGNELAQAQALLVGESAVQGLGGAPPSAAATLVIGFTPLGAQLQGQLFGPFPSLLIATATDAAGEAQQALSLPSLAALTGKRVYMQWWIDDTTTSAAGDLASSQVGIFTIGTP